MTDRHKSRARTRILRFGALIVGCIVGVGLVEALATFLAWSKYGTVDVVRLNELDAGNAYGGEVADEWKGFAETVRPHPWLGIVPSDNESDARWHRVALVENFPTARDPQKFTVLLTGGSVALLLGVAGDGKITYLEEALAKYDFGGREVVVLNAAEGACSQPRQAIAALLYADVCDAVVCLDGFNESSFVGRVPDGRFRFEAPADWFGEFNVLASNAYERLGASWQTNQLRRFSMAHNSRAVFYITRFLRQRIEASAPESDRAASRRPFVLPTTWSQQQCHDFNMRQYQKYVRSMNTLVTLNGAKCAFFIQPCPAIGKKLTADELHAVGDLNYVDTYQQMTDGLLKLNEEGIPVKSLLDVFDGTSESVYIDPVHNNFSGYRIMSERMANELAELWGLKLR